MPSTLEKLELSNSAVSCFFPPHTTSKYVCAVESAQKYKQWLLQQRRDIQQETETNGLTCDCNC